VIDAERPLGLPDSVARERTLVRLDSNGLSPVRIALPTSRLSAASNYQRRPATMTRHHGWPETLTTLGKAPAGTLPHSPKRSPT